MASREGRHGWSRARDKRVEDIASKETIDRLVGKGFGANRIANVLQLPEERVRQVMAYYGYCGRGDGIADRHVSPEEERASAESLALAPEVEAAAQEYRKQRLERMANEHPRTKYYQIVGDAKPPVPAKFLFPYGLR